MLWLLHKDVCLEIISMRPALGLQGILLYLILDLQRSCFGLEAYKMMHRQIYHQLLHLVMAFLHNLHNFQIFLLTLRLLDLILLLAYSLE